MDESKDWNDADRAAAHELLVELRTRITMQPLPYQFGVESTALQSVKDMFEKTREIMRKHAGCEFFVRRASELVNIHLRPFTSKWHRELEEGRLASKDGADLFRFDLSRLRETIQEFAGTLHVVAYGKEACFAGELTGPAIEPNLLESFQKPIPFGIPENWLGETGESEAGPTAADNGGTRTIREVLNEQEAQSVKARRDNLKLASRTDNASAIGLALSGGGIRSATFSLGVIQVLAERKMLGDVDFLSTVSGGGYTGSFLTRTLGKSNSDQESVANPYGPDPEDIQRVRHHAKYLNPVDRKDAWGIVVTTLFGTILNWLAPLGALTVAAAIATISRNNHSAELWPRLTMWCGIALAPALLLYGMSLRTKWNWGLKVLAWLSAVTAAFGAFWLADLGFEKFEQMVASPIAFSMTTVFSAVAAFAPVITKFVPLFERPAFKRLASKFILWLSGLFVPVLALIVFYALQLAAGRFGSWTVLGIGTLICVISYFIVDINLTGPHRIYRARLAKTFVESGGTPTTSPALSHINESGRAPYHLINTTVNLPNSSLPELRDRKADFFLFSKYWCGSVATAYFPAHRWLTNDDEVDLATAMAVSGAAASSYMGIETKPHLTALLTFLNVRLGLWIREPGKSPCARPGFVCLFKEMLRLGMSENSSWLNLSDGGHIENMGVYELIRRRCKYIICVDGEADPFFTFGGLMTLVRHVQLDFGVRINVKLGNLRPNAETGFCRSHFVLGDIDYPSTEKSADGSDGWEKGLFLYLKLSVTGNESEMIRRYRTLHPAFPHQSTADQFFNEEQFEAYRSLGVHVAEGLFSPAICGATPGAENGADGGVANVGQPQSIEELFAKILPNLLDPEVGPKPDRRPAPIAAVREPSRRQRSDSAV